MGSKTRLQEASGAARIRVCTSLIQVARICVAHRIWFKLYAPRDRPISVWRDSNVWRERRTLRWFPRISMWHIPRDSNVWRERRTLRWFPRISLWHIPHAYCVDFLAYLWKSTQCAPFTPHIWVIYLAHTTWPLLQKSPIKETILYKRDLSF